MRPSSRFTYALKAMVDLAVHQGTGPVTTAAVAKRQGIPARSLEQLFNRLRRGGLVQAARGPRGGYRLHRPASEIPVGEIFDALEPKGTVAHASRRKTPIPATPGASSSTADPAHAIWQQVERAVRTTLDATSLEALAAQVRESSPEPLDHRFTFHI
ncbi:MAG: Rrf2 family transcriptional regulator [Candidatus Omnitrophica bacterium]|nr:Rrf2 family transcriptional regulator [Candidatus Omnitrophota bacterium]